MVFALLTGCSSFTAKPYNERRAAGPKIWWTLVDNAEAECILRGSPPPGPFIVIRACAIISVKNECEIITEKNTTMEILGHETRHCFEGQFHD